MKTRLLALTALALATALPGTAWADLAFNASVVSDYRYRGLSQSRLKPAVQAGADWSSGPFYAGAWASTIRWIKDAGGDAGIELDLYGGYKGELSKALTYDLGFLTYQYPSNKLNPKAETNEVYAALTYGPATLKYSHSLGNLFGFAQSKGSGYLDLSASFDVGHGLTLVPHVGRQRVARLGSASYTDASLTLNYEAAKGLVASATALDAKTGAYFGAGKDLGKRAVVLGLKYSF